MFVGFLFKFLIWFGGCFCLSNIDFWVVGGCFFGSWLRFFESLVVVGGGFDGCFSNSRW